MNFSNFLDQYQQLKNTLPRNPTFSTDVENSEYVSSSVRMKHCYFCFDCVDCTRCLYCFDSVRCTDCINCDYAVECELIYEGTDTYQSYNCIYVDYCARLYDSYYCWDCNDSHDLFGCVHLKHKQYCIFNVQYTKEAYVKKIKELLALLPNIHLKTVKNLSQTFPLGPTNVTHAENCDYGNHVHYSKNCYLCFDVARSENCGYMYDSFYCKDSYDLTYCVKAESSHECVDSYKIYNCTYCEVSTSSFDSNYLYNCTDCHNCFGCVGLSHKRYCILNTQYTKEDYEKMVEAIKSTAR